MEGDVFATVVNRDKTGQREITFSKLISTFMINSNLRLDYLSEFRVGARALQEEQTASEQRYLWPLKSLGCHCSKV